MKQTAFCPYKDFFIDFTQGSQINNMKVQHYHDVYEIYFQISGERELFINDICYTLSPGDLYILKPFEIHYTQTRKGDDYERYVMNFSATALNSFLSESEMGVLFDRLGSCVIHLDEMQQLNVLDSFKKAEMYAKRKGLFTQKLLYSSVFQLIMLVHELTATAQPVKSQYIQPEIVEAIFFINNHYMQSMDLDFLAEKVHLSKFHLSRLFHKATGATFLEYLYNVRLTKVHKMLMTTDLTLHEIAVKTGFTSTAHLTRIFRQVYEVSPRTFRKSLSLKGGLDVKN